MAPRPSLKGLQAFEAAARTGSFAAAAAELSVSPAAVSQLIRGLEDQVGRRLFHRIKRGIAPTEAALEVLPRLSAAFEELQDLSGRLSGSGGQARITISVPPSVAAGWLSTRIAGFIATHGPHRLSIRGEEDPVAFDRDGIDLRLTYGRFHYREHNTEAMVTDTAFPVCSPGFLDRHGPLATVEQVARVPLIHTDWGPAAATFPTWRSWFEAAGGPVQARAGHDLMANSSKAALDLAVGGLGLVLSQGFFAAQPLAEGRLVRPLEQALALAHPYCLTVPERSARRPGVQAFKDWLVRECVDAVAATQSAMALR